MSDTEDFLRHATDRSALLKFLESQPIGTALFVCAIPEEGSAQMAAYTPRNSYFEVLGMYTMLSDYFDDLKQELLGTYRAKETEEHA